MTGTIKNIVQCGSDLSCSARDSAKTISSAGKLATNIAGKLSRGTSSFIDGTAFTGWSRKDTTDIVADVATSQAMSSGIGFAIGAAAGLAAHNPMVVTPVAAAVKTGVDALFLTSKLLIDENGDYIYQKASGSHEAVTSDTATPAESEDYDRGSLAANELPARMPEAEEPAASKQEVINDDPDNDMWGDDNEPEVFSLAEPDKRLDPDAWKAWLCQVVANRLIAHGVKILDEEDVHLDEDSPAVWGFRFAKEAGSKIPELGHDFAVDIGLPEGVLPMVKVNAGDGWSALYIPKSVDDRKSVSVPKLIGSAKDSGYALPWVIGTDLNGINQSIDLAEKDSLVIVGGKGSGKTNILLASLAGLCFLRSPEKVRVRLLNAGIKGQGIERLSGYMHVDSSCSGGKEIIASLKEVCDLIDARKQELLDNDAFDITDMPAGSRMPRLVVVCDGIERIASMPSQAGSEGMACIKRMMDEGKIVGVTGVFTTTSMAKKVLGSEVVESASARIVMKLKTPEASRMALGNSDAAKLVSGTGDNFYVDENMNSPMRSNSGVIEAHVINGIGNRIASTTQNKQETHNV